MNEGVRRGIEAEDRVESLCKDLGFKTHKSHYLDHSMKIDVGLKVDGLNMDYLGLQVSCSPKSEKTQKMLAKRGVYPVVAGEQVDQSELENHITETFSDWWNRVYAPLLYPELLKEA